MMNSFKSFSISLMLITTEKYPIKSLETMLVKLLIQMKRYILDKSIKLLKTKQENVTSKVVLDFQWALDKYVCIT